MPPSPSFPFGAVLTAAAALAAVLALVLLAGRAARAAGLARGAGGSQHLAVREVLALDGRRRLHRVACGGREVLLLTGGGTDVVVGWLPPEAEGRP